jgi:hypothetical protein
MILRRKERRPSMRYLCAVLLATIITIGMAPAAHSVTDREKLGRLLREVAPRFGTVFSAEAVAEALQKAKTLCFCFDSVGDVARVGFIVFTAPQAAGEPFTALCLTPVFAVDGGSTAGTGVCADFTPLPGTSAP